MPRQEGASGPLYPTYHELWWTTNYVRVGGSADGPFPKSIPVPRRVSPELGSLCFGGFITASRGSLDNPGVIGDSRLPRLCGTAPSPWQNGCVWLRRNRTRRQPRFAWPRRRPWAPPVGASVSVGEVRSSCGARRAGRRRREGGKPLTNKTLTKSGLRVQFPPTFLPRLFGPAFWPSSTGGRPNMNDSLQRGRSHRPWCVGPTRKR